MLPARSRPIGVMMTPQPMHEHIGGPQLVSPVLRLSNDDFEAWHLTIRCP